MVLSPYPDLELINDDVLVHIFSFLLPLEILVLRSVGVASKINIFLPIATILILDKQTDVRDFKITYSMDQRLRQIYITTRIPFSLSIHGYNVRFRT